MNKLDQAVLQRVKAIEASCPRLLNALHYSPEALWGEIQALEYACNMLVPCGEAQSKALTQMRELAAGLRAQLATDGLMDAQELEHFRDNVAAIETSAKTVIRSLR